MDFNWISPAGIHSTLFLFKFRLWFPIGNAASPYSFKFPYYFSIHPPTEQYSPGQGTEVMNICCQTPFKQGRRTGGVRNWGGYRPNTSRSTRPKTQRPGIIFLSAHGIYCCPAIWTMKARARLRKCVTHPRRTRWHRTVWSAWTLIKSPAQAVLPRLRVGETHANCANRRSASSTS